MLIGNIIGNSINNFREGEKNADNQIQLILQHRWNDDFMPSIYQRDNPANVTSVSIVQSSIGDHGNWPGTLIDHTKNFHFLLFCESITRNSLIDYVSGSLIIINWHNKLMTAERFMGEETWEVSRGIKK